MERLVALDTWPDGLVLLYRNMTNVAFLSSRAKRSNKFFSFLRELIILADEVFRVVVNSLRTFRFVVSIFIILFFLCVLSNLLMIGC
jgi:hypothetical protein